MTVAPARSSVVNVVTVLLSVWDNFVPVPGSALIAFPYPENFVGTVPPLAVIAAAMSDFAFAMFCSFCAVVPIR